MAAGRLAAMPEWRVPGASRRMSRLLADGTVVIRDPGTADAIPFPVRPTATLVAYGARYYGLFLLSFLSAGLWRCRMACALA